MGVWEDELCQERFAASSRGLNPTLMSRDA
jgi:hypothetical protein